MILIQMKIARHHTAERTQYSYPPGYDAKKIVFGPVYESSLPENFVAVVARGDSDEFILIGVADGDAAGFLAIKDAEEVNYTKALELGNTWTKQIEQITKPTLVISLCAKAVRGEVLTFQDQEVLDPDSPEPGINKSKAFKDSLDEALAK